MSSGAAGAGARDATFLGLGNQWWRTVFDGCYQKYGPLVFDNGLHDGCPEPGYYASMQKAYRFAGKNLSERPDPAFYRELHKRVTAHFDGQHFSQEGRTAAQVGGIYRIESGLCSGCVENAHFEELGDVAYALMRRRKRAPQEKKAELLQQLSVLEEQLRKIQTKTQKHIEKVTQDVNIISEERGYSTPFIRFLVFGALPDEYSIFEYSVNSLRVRAEYLIPCEEVESVVADIFEQFNAKMNVLEGEEQIPDIVEQKIRLIADFYQKLEWLHPFQDGQGRVDLTLLAWALARYDLTPAILEAPYYSSNHTLDEWVLYLKAGMEIWQEVRRHPPPGRRTSIV